MGITLTGAVTEAWRDIELRNGESIKVLVRRPTAAEQLQMQALQTTRPASDAARAAHQIEIDRFVLLSAIVDWRGVLTEDGHDYQFSESALLGLIAEHGGFHQLLGLAYGAFRSTGDLPGNSGPLPSGTSEAQRNTPTTTSTGPSSESGSDSTDTDDSARKPD